MFRWILKSWQMCQEPEKNVDKICAYFGLCCRPGKWFRYVCRCLSIHLRVWIVPNGLLLWKLINFPHWLMSLWYFPYDLPLSPSAYPFIRLFWRENIWSSIRLYEIYASHKNRHNQIEGTSIFGLDWKSFFTSCVTKGVAKVSPYVGIKGVCLYVELAGGFGKHDNLIFRHFRRKSTDKHLVTSTSNVARKKVQYCILSTRREFFSLFCTFTCVHQKLI